MSAGIITKVSYWPEGCDPEHYDAPSFQVDVTWRGGDLYSVDWRFWQLSKRGKWTHRPLEMNRKHYRYSWTDANSRAAEVVETLKVNGRTWAEWETFKANEIFTPFRESVKASGT